MDEALLLRDERRKWFLEMESAPGKDGMNVVEMTTNELEYDTHLLDRATAGSERTVSNLERSPGVGKRLSNSITCYRRSISERKRQSMWQTSLLSYERNCHSHPRLQLSPP